jgi:hypothetical protein
MFRVIKRPLELRTGEIRTKTTVEKLFAMAAFSDTAFSIEHLTFASLTSWAIFSLLPFAITAVCTTHPDLFFVH